MARSEISVSEILKTAELLHTAARRLDEAARAATEGGLPSVLLHWQTVHSRYLPKILDWSVMLGMDVALQVDAFRCGRRSAAEAEKQAYAARVAAEAAKESAAAQLPAAVPAGRGQVKRPQTRRRGG